MLLRPLALAVAILLPCALSAQQQPTAEEAAFIYKLNRARQNPQRYDTENSLGNILNGGGGGRAGSGNHRGGAARAPSSSKGAPGRVTVSTSSGPSSKA